KPRAGTSLPADRTKGAAVISRKRIARALDRLEPLVEEVWGAWEEECARKAAERQRWKVGLHRFGEGLPEGLWDRAEQALNDERCRLWRWLEDIVRGRSRLPACLTPDVMRQQVLVRLNMAPECGGFEGVCLHCGLQYPVSYFTPLTEWKSPDGCPAC